MTTMVSSNNCQCFCCLSLMKFISNSTFLAVVVVYHNPYDNVAELAHLFFKRCFEANITPYIVTKKTVFKWQEGFWETMKAIFDKEYKEDFLKVRTFVQLCHGLIFNTNNSLCSFFLGWSSRKKWRRPAASYLRCCYNAAYSMDRRWLWNGSPQLRW